MQANGSPIQSSNATAFVGKAHEIRLCIQTRDPIGSRDIRTILLHFIFPEHDSYRTYRASYDRYSSRSVPNNNKFLFWFVYINTKTLYHVRGSPPTFQDSPQSVLGRLAKGLVTSQSSGSPAQSPVCHLDVKPSTRESADSRRRFIRTH